MSRYANRPAKGFKPKKSPERHKSNVRNFLAGTNRYIKGSGRKPAKQEGCECKFCQS